MRLIIDVPDELVSAAFALAMEESKDYRRRFDKPGWGWTFWKSPNHYWIRGIKGGLSVSLVRPAKNPPSIPSEASTGTLAQDDQNPSQNPSPREQDGL